MSEVSEIPAEDWALWRTWVSANQQLSRALDRQLQRDRGISQADYIVLLALFEAPDHHLRTGELAELIAWEKSRVSHQVARMESRGLVERTECETDARGTWIGLTTEGRRALLGAMREHTTAIRELFFEQLEPGEKAVLRTATKRILDKLNPAACELARDDEAAAVPA